MAKPIVVIAEELSPATVEALGPDFDRRSALSNKTLPSVAQIEGEAAGSFIPYEGALRFIASFHQIPS